MCRLMGCAGRLTDQRSSWFWTEHRSLFKHHGEFISWARLRRVMRA